MWPPPLFGAIRSSSFTIWKRPFSSFFRSGVDSGLADSLRRGSMRNYPCSESDLPIFSNGGPHGGQIGCRKGHEHSFISFAVHAGKTWQSKTVAVAATVFGEVVGLARDASLTWRDPFFQLYDLEARLPHPLLGR